MYVFVNSTYYGRGSPLIDIVLILTSLFMGMVWIILYMRDKKQARLDKMREEDAEDEELDRPDKTFFLPSVPENGLVIQRDVTKSKKSVLTFYSCNNCGTPLKSATLCGICATKKPVSF